MYSHWEVREGAIIMRRMGERARFVMTYQVWILGSYNSPQQQNIQLEC